MHTTDNYQLSQWDAADRILMADFNSDNAKIDAALAEQAADLAAVAAKMGNCRISISTYTGTGTYGSDNKTTVTFDAPPVLIIVTDNQGYSFLIHGRSFEAYSQRSPIYASLTGSTATWYGNGSASDQFNSSGVTYYVFAFFMTD